MAESRSPIDASVYRLAYLGLARQVTGRATLTTEELHHEYGGKPDAKKLDQSIVQLAFQQGLNKQQVFDLLAVSPQIQHALKQEGQSIEQVKQYAIHLIQHTRNQGSSREQRALPSIVSKEPRSQ
ncbi:MULTISPECIES: hypothetical protein [Leptolyngbya]|jgi:cellobiose-specific phosphotransferase system component IIB|uniref:Uncharacterized protein n=1 Tax=Leptolyngbya boryana NIES-2135 TaxID=1973484 RepID=A0A1Z4JT66_LEPBY|nr:MULTISPECIES: hypothetical protein [Leptolyngbya]BAY59843.1 hypothetical protein NIES2135_67200 [Leptolyngbya boryana NIES-2135]MBD2369606.1 hypothetical protein [Leptolyngbya sp. FACHB-161]MBD2375949.1 hypothetical protein [Leptolyngbya sp. FACHB-238]MBD2400225.1 hypothetical protein [Leptolyngbya sp. FACHB-239]MBD2406766.1 hypothetical protein [Leptolyngbya sp. FACHB-402]